MPTSSEFPYVVRVESLITESCGSSSMASVCGGALSMMAAGVPLKRVVAGVAMGLLLDESGGGGEPIILTDILGSEDALGTMDFKVHCRRVPTPPIPPTRPHTPPPRRFPTPHTPRRFPTPHTPDASRGLHPYSPPPRVHPPSSPPTLPIHTHHAHSHPPCPRSRGTQRRSPPSNLTSSAKGST